MTLVADGGAQGTDCDGAGGRAATTSRPVPIKFGTSGNRSFATSTVGTIYFDNRRRPRRWPDGPGGAATPLQ